jgi:hypothetical protein
MLPLSPDRVDVVAARVYALILGSKRLQPMLLPNGLPTSPYEILDYDVTLTIHDVEGMRATFERSQEVRFLQQGVAGVLDHAWGTGVAMSGYHNDAGGLEDSFRDDGRQHMVIALKRAMGLGERLKFRVARSTMASFATEEQRWMDTTIDHPIWRLRVGVTFPRERPVQSAVIEHAGGRVSLPVQRLRDERTAVHFVTPAARAYVPYVIRCGERERRAGQAHHPRKEPSETVSAAAFVACWASTHLHPLWTSSHQNESHSQAQLTVDACFSP